ncbi:Afadin and alpha-actinin-binding-domain-containing protein [Bombardia bombarda]|uniref:Afadin and alpha-actinin-binding-domain-containing protein n=1 Tax=Bombardia bombarda TaxID=252184 RepID=A0AA40CFA7_9PEZI|nr:Afadin and alpha-actinin-binding-domain-containing protein [Bombardia bombarda]
MTASDSLRTASLYINNQLLSRGLLRDGETIDFTYPGDTDGEVAATMGRVMAVVNDLILRRDRDAEHRESLATSLRTLRAESLRQTNDIQRLHEKYMDAQRKVALGESTETTLRAQLKAAEATVQRLKDEAARTKTLVAQTRATCTNEVRKRDRQIEGLKKAVSEAGRARGSGKSSIMSISVVGDVSPAADQGAVPTDNTTAADHGYDLRMETNSFLAELAKGLSGENETLLDLVRRTTKGLKEMSGWDREDGGAAANENADGHALTLPTNCQDMSSEIDQILNHLRTILTNPSFVPIEEVVVREDEIHRLRHGWEKMESRWQEAVHLIDGWRKRMQVSGRPVNIEELKMGLRLSPVKVKHVEETVQGFGPGLRLSAVPEDPEERSHMRTPSPAGSLRLAAAASGLDDVDDSDCASSIFEDDDDIDIDVDDLDVDEPNVEILQQSIMMDSSPLPVPPQLTPLRDSHAAGNRGKVGHLDYLRRPAASTPTKEEKTWEFKDEAPLPPPHLEKPQQSPMKKPVQQQPPPRSAPEMELISPISTEMSASVSSLDSVLLVKPPSDESTTKTSAASTKSHKRPSPSTGAKQPEAKRPAPSSRQQQQQQQQPPAKKTTRSRPAVTTRDATTRQPRPRREGNETPAATKPSRTRGTTRSAAASVTSNNTSGIDSGADSQGTTTTTSTTNRRPSGGKPAATTITTSTSTSTGDMAPPPLPLAPPSSTHTTNAADTSLLSQSPNRSPRRVNSRLPLLRTTNLLPPPQQSPLSMATIAAKLAASEREADAARVRAKLKAARIGGRKRDSLAPSAAGSEGTATGTADGAGNSSSIRSEEGVEYSEDRGQEQELSRSGKRDAAGMGDGGEMGGDGADELAGSANGHGHGPPQPPPHQRQQQQAQERERGREKEQRRQQREERQRERERERGREREVVQEQEILQQQQMHQQPRRKRDRQQQQQTAGGRGASRRRSTLNPWELKTLIEGNVDVVAAVAGATAGST